MSGEILAFRNERQKETNASLIVEKGVCISGNIYCEGIIEFKGELIGSLACEGFILHTPTSVYENTLFSVTMKPADKQASTIGAMNHFNSILKWLN